jgi:hypothetical protein
MKMSDATAARARVSLVAVTGLGLAMTFGLASCDGTGGAGTVTSGQGGQLQRIDAVEYDRSIQSTLGVSLSNEDRLSLVGHDREITPADYQRHFDLVQVLAAQVFADPALRGRIVTCTPASEVDTACTQSIIRQFGAVAWQRPVSETELAQLTGVAATATALGNDFPQTIEQVVKTMMISAPFLYRVQGV